MLVHSETNKTHSTSLRPAPLNPLSLSGLEIVDDMCVVKKKTSHLCVNILKTFFF